MPNLQPIKTVFDELVKLEQQVADQARKEGLPTRVYDLIPVEFPELPAIWNDVDEGAYENVDTARADDVITLTATIAVRPSDRRQGLADLLTLADIFRAVTGPHLRNRPGDLNRSVRRAKRVATRTSWEEWDLPGGPVAIRCMDMLIRCELTSMFE